MKQKITQYAFWIPIIVYIIYAICNIVDAPFLDDYHVFLRSGLEMIQAKNDLDIAQILTRRQQYEHRLFFNKFYSILSLWFTGKVNFAWVAYFGNAILIALFLYWTNRPSILLTAWEKVFLALLFFTPQHWQDSLLWGTCILQHTPTNLFLFAAFVFVSKNQLLKTVLAVFILGLGAFTSSHGIIGFPLCVVIILIFKNYKNAIYFCLLSIPFLLFYFYKGNYGHPVADFSAPLWENFGLKLKTFFIFIGNFAYFLPAAIARPLNQQFLVPMLCGILLFIGYILLFLAHIKRVFFEKNIDLIALHTMAIALLGTMLLGCFARGFQGFEMGVIDRYAIYSISFLVIFFILFFQILAISNNFFKIVLFCSAFFYSFLAYNFYDSKLQTDLIAIKADAYNLEYNGKAFLRSFSDSTNYWQPELKAGISNYPKNLIKRSKHSLSLFHSVALKNDTLQFKNDWANIKWVKVFSNETAMIQLKSVNGDSSRYFLPLPNKQSQSVWYTLKNKDFQQDTLYVPIKKSWIPVGNYLANIVYLNSTKQSQAKVVVIP